MTAPENPADNGTALDLDRLKAEDGPLRTRKDGTQVSMREWYEERLRDRAHVTVIGLSHWLRHERTCKGIGSTFACTCGLHEMIRRLEGMQ